MTKQLKVSALVAALLVSASAFAAKPGYLSDAPTNTVVRNNYNECWKTPYFNKDADGLVECGDKVAVAPAPAPTPTLVAVQEKVSLSAEVLFAFNQAVLRPEAKDVLDPLVAKLKAAGANLTSIEIDGYTDFFGSEKYNLKLSQERADAVKAYFIAAGLPAEQVTAVGKGEAQDGVTEECKAKKLKTKAELKACVAPDRRVDIVINAMQEKVVEQK